MISPDQKQELRWAVLTVLAARQSTALRLPAILERLRREQRVDFPVGETDVQEALAYLAGDAPPLAKTLLNRLGAEVFYQATTEGVRAQERGPIQ